MIIYENTATNDININHILLQFSLQYYKKENWTKSFTKYPFLFPDAIAREILWDIRNTKKYVIIKKKKWKYVTDIETLGVKSCTIMLPSFEAKNMVYKLMNYI
jgi:hypothetical protein